MKILWKRGEIAPEEQFLLFSTIFSIYLLTSGVKLHIHLLIVVVRFIVFLTSANLICRGTDISKYSRESLGLRDNESRLYVHRNKAPIQLDQSLFHDFMILCLDWNHCYYSMFILYRKAVAIVVYVFQISSH